MSLLYLTTSFLHGTASHKKTELRIDTYIVSEISSQTSSLQHGSLSDASKKLMCYGEQQSRPLARRSAHEADNEPHPAALRDPAPREKAAQHRLRQRHHSLHDAESHGAQKKGGGCLALYALLDSRHMLGRMSLLWSVHTSRVLCRLLVVRALVLAVQRLMYTCSRDTCSGDCCHCGQPMRLIFGIDYWSFEI